VYGILKKFDMMVMSLSIKPEKKNFYRTTLWNVELVRLINNVSFNQKKWMVLKIADC